MLYKIFYKMHVNILWCSKRMCTVVVVMTMRMVGGAATVCNEGRKVESKNFKC